jgi:hypothetical protein
MSLASLIKGISQDNIFIARRPAQTYLVATGAYTVFTVTGAVEILSFGGLVTGAAVGATTLATTFNGIAGDAGAVAINGAVGTVVFVGLNVAAAILNAAAVPKTVATLTTMIVGSQPAGAVGNIVLTFGVGTSWTGEWFAVYRKLSQGARIQSP